MKAKKYPSKEFFQNRLNYDPLTGVFTWREVPGNNTGWNTRFAGKAAGYATQPHGYMVITMTEGTFMLNRVALIMGGVDLHEDMDADHINRKVSDNRLCNLRPASRADNTRNQVRHNKTGYRGVTVCKNSIGAVVIDSHGVRRTKFGFSSTKEAAVYRDAWAIKETGEFAVTNFPRSLYYLSVKNGPHSLHK